MRNELWHINMHLTPLCAADFGVAQQLDKIDSKWSSFLPSFFLLACMLTSACSCRCEERDSAWEVIQGHGHAPLDGMYGLYVHACDQRVFVLYSVSITHECLRCICGFCHRFTYASPLRAQAPEVLLGQKFDVKCDLWSLGVTTIEMADGVPPNNDAQNLLRVIKMIPTRAPPTLQEPSRWPADMNAFIGRCVQKRPDERPTAMDLLISDAFVKRARGPEVMRARIEEAMSLRAAHLAAEPADAQATDDVLPPSASPLPAASSRPAEAKRPSPPPLQPQDEAFQRSGSVDMRTTVYTHEEIQREVLSKIDTAPPLLSNSGPSLLKRPGVSKLTSALQDSRSPATQSPGHSSAGASSSAPGGGVRAPSDLVTHHDLDTFQQLVQAEVQLQLEQVKADFIALLNREIEIREKKNRLLEAEIERLKKHGR